MKDYTLATSRALLCVFVLLVMVAMIFAVESHNTQDDSAPVVPTVSTTETTTPTIMPETTPTYTEPVETLPEETIPEVTEPPVTEETNPTTESEPMSELEMLACVIYQEAGGNACCDDCRRYVGDIVLNRINDPRFPNTMYEVLTAPYQYGRFHWTGIVWPDRASNPNEAEAVARAYRIAEELLSGNHSKVYGAGYIWQAEFVQGNEEDGLWHCGHFFGRG